MIGEQGKLQQKSGRRLGEPTRAEVDRGASTWTSTPAKLFYTEAGSGRNTLLLHGWTCDSHDWSWQMPALESRYKVIALDLRGHGRSEILPSGAYSPNDYVGDIEQFISTNYPDQSFVIIGHSMGAQIAARLSRRRPDLVDGVVSIDGSLGFSNDLLPVFQETVNGLSTDYPAAAAHSLFEAVYDPATPPANRRWHARRTSGVPDYVIRETLPPLFFGTDQVGIGDASQSFCESLTVPFYHLSRDMAQAERMRSWFSHPLSKVDYFSEAGHWIMQDRPDDVNFAITQWIDKLSNLSK